MTHAYHALWLSSAIVGTAVLYLCRYKQVYAEPPLSTWRYPDLLLRSCAAYQISIDICCRRPRSAANQPHAAAAVDRRNRQTGGRTSDRYIDPDYYYYFFNPGTQFPRNEKKITLCNTLLLLLLFIYYATCAATNKVKYAYTKTKTTKIIKKCSTNYTTNVYYMQICGPGSTFNTTNRTKRIFLTMREASIICSVMSKRAPVL